MRDVAARARVSVGTVSNVLNNPQVVAPATRTRVEQAIRDLDFVPNAPARQLRAGRAKVIGLVVPDIANPFFTEVARGVEDAAMAAGFAVILCNSNGQAEREDAYLRILQSQRVGAVLITPARKGLAPLRHLLGNGAAIALLDNDDSTQQVCSASVDDALGGFLAAQHVIDLGHASFAWLAGPSDIPQVADREAGVIRASSQVGLDFTRVLATHMSAAAGDAAIASALERGPLPTAIVCANDLLAIGAMRAIGRAGLRIPEDVSVIGYDDISFAEATSVPLTSIRQPKVELGQAAAGLVIAEWRDPASHVHQHVRFQPSIIVRASTAPPTARHPS